MGTPTLPTGIGGVIAKAAMSAANTAMSAMSVDVKRRADRRVPAASVAPEAVGEVMETPVSSQSGCKPDQHN